MNAAKLTIAMIGMLALGGPAWANVGNQVVDGVIPAGTATVDGDLSEWTGAIWNKANRLFTGDPTVEDPSWDPEWTARWDGNTIYLAVRVIDDTPSHTDAYVGFAASDRLEIFSRGSSTPGGTGDTGLGAGTENYGNQPAGYNPAQHYFVGITDTSLDSGGGDSWATLGAAEFPASFVEARNLVNDGTDALFLRTSATGTPGGTHTLIYEVAIKQYDDASGFDATSAATSNTGLRTLALGDTVGLSVAAASVSPLGGYDGTVSAGGINSMFNRFNRIGLYKLVTDVTVGDFDFDDNEDVDGADFLRWQRGDSPAGFLSPSDLADWEANYGDVGPLAAGVGAVPEPSSVVLISLALAGLASGWRRRK